ncbi:MAG: sulfatase-like hydrolase/transferase [Granulosicoccus sp.]
MLKMIKAGTLLVVSVLLVTFLCRAVITYGFDVTLEPEYWYRDFAGNLAVTLVVALLVRSLPKTLILAGVVIVMFQLSNAAKLSVLGTPASPDDLLNVQNVFFLTDGWRQIALFLVAGMPLILAIAFIPWKKISLWLTLLALGLAGFAINAQSEPLRVLLDKQFGNSVWNQPANYRQRGLALHLAQEVVRTISKVEKPPEKEEVASALDTLAFSSPDDNRQGILEPDFQEALGDISITSERNIHMFVLESFFDPVSLGEQWVPEDPLPEEFRKLWKETGNTATLSPVFGGYTANAEFEVLCGFPVTRNAVFFEGWLRNTSPCLPRLLGQAGYHTLASHPNVPGFWNRTNAYQLVGFDEYLSKAQFDMTDSIDTLLLDHSMYQQVFEHIDQLDLPGPVFNYMLTYHGHLPYPSNEAYPDQVKPGKESVLLNGYLNQIWYKSRDLMERLAILRKADPDALIVIFGDHLPFLGPNYGVYTEAWALPETRSDFTGEHLEKLTSTPLIVIDGQRGPLNLGKIPLYRLPSLLMSLLGTDQQLMFDASVNPGDKVIRPVYGMHYTVQEQATTACTEDNTGAPPCNTTEPWLNQIKVLIGDLFTGEQFSLQ